MNVRKVPSITLLSRDEVCINTVTYVTIDDEEYTINKPKNDVYYNTAEGRIALVEADFPEELVRAILYAWGNAPTLVPLT